MKTSINTGEVSSPLAHEAGWDEKNRAEQGGGSEKHGFVVETWLDKPCDGRKIAETTGKTKFEP
ncbi:MAG: hypothetical protein ACLQQ0_12070 [Limisphaerales bacterium]